MFIARVYKIMIGSLSGAMEEVFAANETIRKWNQENAEDVGAIFLPVECSTKSENLNKVDVVIGVVGNWIENLAFIEECIQMGKKVIIFFQTYHDPKVSIPAEIQKVEEFKNKVQSVSHCVDYSCKREFECILSRMLSKLL